MCESLRQTPGKNAKVAAIEYLPGLDDSSLLAAVLFLSGVPINCSPLEAKYQVKIATGTTAGLCCAPRE